MRYYSVSSRAIRSLGYDESSMTMVIEFTSGSQSYTYCGVPKSVFSAFLAAGSKGTFYHDYIKDNYDC